MRMRPNNYKIVVRALQGDILTFNVENYTIVDGGFVSFLDRKTNQYKRFHSSNCEIYTEE